MQIVQQRPHSALAPYVRCYWEITHQLTDGIVLNVPFGCTGRTHWLITIRNTYQTTFDEGGQLPIYDFTVVGQITRPITQHITTSVTGILVDFTATGLHRLWAVPTPEFANQNVDAEAVFGPAVRSFVAQLRDAPSRAARFRVVDEYLLRQLTRVRPTDHRIETAARLLQNGPGHHLIHQLADFVSCTERTLNRRFTEAVGLSPKHYARVQRFLQARRWLDEHSTGNWRDLPTLLGYYDQAHFIHEFRGFTGRSPTLYGADQQPLHDLVRRE